MGACGVYGLVAAAQRYIKGANHGQDPVHSSAALSLLMEPCQLPCLPLSP